MLGLSPSGAPLAGLSPRASLAGPHARRSPAPGGLLRWGALVAGNFRVLRGLHSSMCGSKCDQDTDHLHVAAECQEHQETQALGIP